MSDPQRFVVLLERLTRVVFNSAHAESLRPVQWEALRFLARANRFSKNPSGLTAYIGTSKGTISQTIIALERKGLLTKTRSSHDARGVALELSAAGLELLQRDPATQLAEAVKPLPAKELDQLNATTEKTLRHLIQQNDAKTFDECHTCRHFLRAQRRHTDHHCGLLKVDLSDDDSRLICIEQEYRPGARKR